MEDFIPSYNDGRTCPIEINGNPKLERLNIRILRALCHDSETCNVELVCHLLNNGGYTSIQVTDDESGQIDEFEFKHHHYIVFCVASPLHSPAVAYRSSRFSVSERSVQHEPMCVGHLSLNKCPSLFEPYLRGGASVCDRTSLGVPMFELRQQTQHFHQGNDVERTSVVKGYETMDSLGVHNMITPSVHACGVYTMQKASDLMVKHILAKATTSSRMGIIGVSRTLEERSFERSRVERKEKVRLSVREKECEGITWLLQASCTLAPSMALVSLRSSLGREASRSTSSRFSSFPWREKKEVRFSAFSRREKNEKVCCHHREGDIASGTPPHRGMKRISGWPSETSISGAFCMTVGVIMGLVSGAHIYVII
ncbi:hypothetical protein M5K25_013836 [Dendrobium thyrsiflorum]|uniref:Uncharacterized protein n=1 Tax=Dendrobium thyrsiflorum TaxID=117978 RepID=A0ABD0V1U5_DENTH